MRIAEVSVLVALPDVFAELAPPSQEALVSIRHMGTSFRMLADCEPARGCGDSRAGRGVA